MARKGYGRNNSLVNVSTHADDGTSPVGSNEWNENPKNDGIFGLAKKTESVSSYSIDITDSYVEVTSSGNEEIRTMVQVTDVLPAANYGASHSDGSGTDGASTAIKSFAEGDLLYLVKANASHVITLKHQYGGSGGAGKITTLTGGNLLLDVKIPRIFMCRTISGVQEWVEYGGGTASDLDTTNFAAATIVTQAEGIANNDNETTLPTSAAVKDYVDTQILTEDNTDEIVEGSTNLYYTEARVNANSNVAANTAKTGITTSQANAITANTAKTGISTAQAALLSATEGTAAASKALVVDSNKDLTGVRNLTVAGDLTVTGTTTTVNVEDLTVDTADITIMNGNTTASAANDSGIKTQVGGSSFKTLLWKHATSAWTSSDNIDSTAYKIAGTTVLSGTTLGSTITGSSLTSIGTLTSGVLTGATGTAAGLTAGNATLAAGLSAVLADNRMPDLTGEVTTTEGAVTTTIADNIIDEANLKVNNSPTDGYVLKALASASGGLTWGTGGGGATTLHKYTASNQTTVFTVSANSIAYDVGTTVASQAAGVGQREVYIRKIDTNNEGVFTIIHKNGALVEVQIA